MRYPNYAIMSDIMNFTSTYSSTYNYYILILDASMLLENKYLYFYNMDDGSWVVHPDTTFPGVNLLKEENLYLFQDPDFIDFIKTNGGLKHILLAREKILDLPFKLRYCEERTDISDLYMPHFGGNPYNKIILLSW